MVGENQVYKCFGSSSVDASERNSRSIQDNSDATWKNESETLLWIPHITNVWPQSKCIKDYS